MRIGFKTCCCNWDSNLGSKHQLLDTQPTHWRFKVMFTIMIIQFSSSLGFHDYWYLAKSYYSTDTHRAPILDWPDQCATNIQIVGSSPTHICPCGMFPQAVNSRSYVPCATSISRHTHRSTLRSRASIQLFMSTHYPYRSVHPISSNISPFNGWISTYTYRSLSNL